MSALLLKRFVGRPHLQRAKQADTQFSSSKERSLPTNIQNQMLLISEFANNYAQGITVILFMFGGAFYTGSHYVAHSVELKSVKESVIEKEKAATEKAKALEMITIEKEKAAAAAAIEKEKAATEKAKALEMITIEKEKALEKLLVEKDKTLGTVLFEKEKTQAAEKRELEARIRELETLIRFGRPPASQAVGESAFTAKVEDR